jgi:UDP-N-acetylmuramoylalanine--D-glutamate ligase
MEALDLKNKRIGIWGFGVVGKAALKALRHHPVSSLAVFDKRALNNAEQELLTKYQARHYQPDHLEAFLHDHDFIVPSPGIDLRPYLQFSSKFISELDLFAASFKSPIIAITGTVGKTTSTSLLAHVLEHVGYNICVGGNIGVGMLDLLHDGQVYDYAVLEVSSFQLELSKFFAPHVALWTNFFPNHLDRHTTMADYFSAKQTMLLHQKATDYAVLPFEIIDLLSPELRANRIFFTAHPLHEHEQKKLLPNDKLLSIDHEWVVLKNHHAQKIIELKNLPTITYQQNILAVLGVLLTLDIPAEQLSGTSSTFALQEHRLEKVATINGVDFYNDSKSTITQSTLAAIDKLQGKPVLLLLGGLSKGVDRSFLFTQIRNKVSEVFCFGQEAAELHKAGMAANMTCHRFDHLEPALQSAVVNAKSGDQILFSPAGSSYDLFSNYQERGKRFKELVTSYQLTR